MLGYQEALRAPQTATYLAMIADASKSLKQHGIVLPDREVELLVRPSDKEQFRQVAFPSDPDADAYVGEPLEVTFNTPAIERDDGHIDEGDPVFAAWFEECSIRPAHGPVGRRIWVKEPWACSVDLEYHQDPCSVHYRTDLVGGVLHIGDMPPVMDRSRRYRWRPAVQMPRWAARIWLEITDIRCHRLQDITDADAKAEGVVGPMCNRIGPDFGKTDYRGAFRLAWEALWSSNPWVWAYTFRRLEPHEVKR